LEKVKQSKVKDDKVIKAVEEMKWARVKMLSNKEWKKIDSIMYKEGKVYVPKNKVLRVEIIRLYHNILVEKYRGHWKTIELNTRNFW